MLNGLEMRLAAVYKGAPKLSSGAKKTVVDIWPWIALIFGLLQLAAALELWHWGHNANNLVDTLNAYYNTTLVPLHHLNLFYWLSVIALIVEALVVLAAFPGLRRRAKRGWRLLFYGALLNFVYGVFSAFNNYGGVSVLIWEIVVTAVVLYFLFAVRDQYKRVKA